MPLHSARPGRVLIGRLDVGSDLLGSLNQICRDDAILQGHLQVIGAVANARFGFFDQEQQCYLPPLAMDEGLEILSCAGTISLMEGVPQVHAHILLGDRDGRAFGGHLHPGTRVFNAEVVVQELLLETPLARRYDPTLGAPLWPLPPRPS